MAEAGRYLYAVTRGIDGSAVESIEGIGDAPVTTVEESGLVAVVGTVDLAEFGEDGLREHLEDLAWLERVARSHDHVVQAVAQLGPTAPLRLATICLDDDGVKERLREWHDGLHAALDRVTGRLEWSAKAYVMPQPSPAGGESDEAAPAASGDGAAYLRRKQAQTRQRRETEQQGVDAARAIHDALGAASVASRLLAPQDPRLTGHEGTMTLNAAYLVPVEAQDAFLAETERLAADKSQVRLEVNGPWPPYSFATLDDQ